jgi:hypothetical protein
MHVFVKFVKITLFPVRIQDTFFMSWPLEALLTISPVFNFCFMNSFYHLLLFTTYRVIVFSGTCPQPISISCFLVVHVLYHFLWQHVDEPTAFYCLRPVLISLSCRCILL